MRKSAWLLHLESLRPEKLSRTTTYILIGLHYNGCKPADVIAAKYGIHLNKKGLEKHKHLKVMKRRAGNCLFAMKTSASSYILLLQGAQQMGPSNIFCEADYEAELVIKSQKI